MDKKRIEDAKEEFDELRYSDPDFKEQWNREDFIEWWEDVYLKTNN